MPTYTAPTTRATGYTLTAANWNAELVENMKFFKDAPVFDVAVIIGAATTAGIRLDLESGVLAVREGDDSGYGDITVGAVSAASVAASGVVSGASMTSSGVITTAGVTSSVALLPSANNSAALGASGTAWADLFLASGGVVDFNAGDTTITHSAGKLTIGGSGAGALDVKGAILPTVDNGAALGASGTAWADLFLASGGFVDFAAGEATITHSASNTLTIGTAGSERLRVTSGGLVGIGTSAPSGTLEIASATDGNVYNGRFSTDAVAANVITRKARGTVASPTAIATSDALGAYAFEAFGGTNWRTLAQVSATASNYTSDTNITSYLGFSTTNAGTSPTERLRIAGNGDVSIGATAKLFLDGVGGGDTYLVESSANNMSFFTGGTLRLRLTSGGDTVIPSGAKLFLDGVGGTNDTYITESAGNAISFFTTGVERLRLGVSPGDNNIGMVATGKFFFDGVAQTGDTYIQESAANRLVFFVGNVEQLRLGSQILINAPSGGDVRLQHNGTLIALTTSTGLTVSAGDVLLGSDNTVSTAATTLRAGDLNASLTNTQGKDLNIRAGSGTGTGGSGNLIFLSQPPSGAVTERMRLTRDGEFWIGYTTDNGAYKLQVNSQIFATNATIATSDARYKTDVVPVRDGLAAIQALRPVQFRWKPHPVHEFITGTDVGFLAQDVQQALAGRDYLGAVVTENGSEDERFLGMADSKIIPLLVAAVQELSARLEACRRVS